MKLLAHRSGDGEGDENYSEEWSYCLKRQGRHSNRALAKEFANGTTRDRDKL